MQVFSGGVFSSPSRFEKHSNEGHWKVGTRDLSRHDSFNYLEDIMNENSYKKENGIIEMKFHDKLIIEDFDQRDDFLDF